MYWIMNKDNNTEQLSTSEKAKQIVDWLEELFNMELEEELKNSKDDSSIR